MYPVPFNPWLWRDPIWLETQPPEVTQDQESDEESERARRGRTILEGYDVEAVDGGIGHIDQASYEIDAAYLVVDTGPWIFGRKVLLPAGTVDRVDHSERKVYVDRTKDQIENAPEFDPDTFEQSDYRQRVAKYYGDTYQ